MPPRSLRRISSSTRPGELAGDERFRRRVVHDARRVAAARRAAASSAASAAVARAARRAQRRRRRARQRDGRVARVGRIRRLRRRRRTAARSTASSRRASPDRRSSRSPMRSASRHGCTPATVLPDVPSHFPTAEEASSTARETTTAAPRAAARAAALAGSENVPAVALARRIGVSGLAALSATAGFTTFEQERGLLRPRRHARATPKSASTSSSPPYAVFARGGVSGLQPTLLMRDHVPRRRGDHSSSRGPRSGSPTSSRTTTRALTSSAAAAASISVPVAAVKTGTSQAYHDNWTIGFTRDVTVGVWVGNFDPRPLTGSSGVTGAGPIFHAVMLAGSEARERHAA